MTTALLTALAFAKREHAVFATHWPVEYRGRLICSCGGELRGRSCGRKAAKHPYGKLAPNGVLSATTEPDIIIRWFRDAEPRANLGVVTDRLVVVDIDPRHNGDESFRALEREHEIPPTWRALTGGGGEHVIFACPDGVTIASFTAENMKSPPLGAGIDVRARGGYFIAPPSRHISGRSYAWSVDHHPRDVPLAPAPDWLITRLTARTTVISPDGAPVEPISSDIWAQLTRNEISEYQDEAACKIAGHLFRHNCNPRLVLGLLHAWNSACCKPPLDDPELTDIVERIANREADRIEAQLGRSKQ